MKLSQVAVFEPGGAVRKRLEQGLKKAGLRVSRAVDVPGLTREHLVVLGPGLKNPSAVSRAARKKRPGILVLAGQTRGFRAGFADAVLPLPISPNDLRVRLADLAALVRLRESPVSGLPTMRPGDGILDPITSFYTFAHFKEVLFVEVKRARRYGFPLALALAQFDELARDIDPELKSRLMGGLALAIRRSLRDTDYPVQYSGERVLLLMPHTDLTGAVVVARRIVERVAKATLSHGEEILHPTVSVGVAAGLPGHEFGFSELTKQAQEGLSAAIAAGGSRVEFPDASSARS